MTPQETLARLIAARKRSRLLPTDILQSAQGLTPGPADPSGQQRPEGALANIFGRLELITDLLNTAFPVFAPDRRIYVTKNADDPYGGNVQAAINAAAALEPPPSALNPAVVEILSPGEYVGNFVLPQHVYLVSMTPGTTLATILRSSSGNTLTVPESDSGITGIAVVSDSPSPADAAISIAPAVGTDPTRLVLARASGLGGAASVRTEIGTGGTGPVVGIYLDCSGSSPVLIDLIGAGMVINLGGAANLSPTGTCIHASGAASFSLIFEGIIQSQAGGSGWEIDAEDGATVAVFGGNAVITGNGFRGRTGAFLGILDYTFYLAPTGTMLELDATALAGLGNIQIGVGANPYDLIVAPVPSNVLFSENLNWREGLLAGRPTTPRPGMRYYATDRAAGTRQLTFVPSLGWVDQTDTVVP